MYNDEKNLYHYTYRKDGSETGEHNAAGQQPAGGQPFTYYEAHETGTAGTWLSYSQAQQSRYTVC